jgi:hypothetical protein
MGIEMAGIQDRRKHLTVTLPMGFKPRLALEDAQFCTNHRSFFSMNRLQR